MDNRILMWNGPELYGPWQVTVVLANGMYVVQQQQQQRPCIIEEIVCIASI